MLKCSMQLLVLIMSDSKFSALVMKMILILEFSSELGSLNVITSPSNVAVIRGNAVELTCRTDSGSLAAHSWTFASVGSSTEISIYNRGIPAANLTTSFQLSKVDDGYLNIKTESAKLEDAGIYMCNIQVKEANGNRVMERSAQLIVLDSEPKCIVTNHTVDTRAVQQLSCSVGYRGNWAPVMEWRKGGSDGQIITTGVHSHTTKDTVTSYLAVDIDSAIEGSLHYTCKTFFSVYTGNVSMTAKNTPQYFYVWPVIYERASKGSLAQRKTEGTGDEADNRLVELAISSGIIVFVLLLLLVFISIRNFQKQGRARTEPITKIEHKPEGKENGGSFLKAEIQHRTSKENHDEWMTHAYPILDAECNRFGSSACWSNYDNDLMTEGNKNQRNCSYFGADGTEYLCMSDFQRKVPPRPIIHAAQYEQSIYASIDHTMRPPALPPRLYY